MACLGIPEASPRVNRRHMLHRGQKIELTPFYEARKNNLCSYVVGLNALDPAVLLVDSGALVGDLDDGDAP